MINDKNKIESLKAQFKAQIEKLKHEVAVAGFEVMKAEIEAVDEDTFGYMSDRERESLVEECYTRLNNDIADWVDDWKQEQGWENCEDCMEVKHPDELSKHVCAECSNTYCNTCSDKLEVCPKCNESICVDHLKDHKKDCKG